LKQADQSSALPQEIELRFSTSFFASWPLDFEDHLRGRIDLGRHVGQIAASGPVRFVSEAGPLAGAPLDDDAIAGPRKLGDDVGNEGNAPLAPRDLTWNSYEHAFRFRGVINAP
jgi:hypothetical protein